MRKGNALIHVMFSASLFSCLLFGCEKDEFVVPELITTSVTTIKQTTAISGGAIATDGGASVTVRGVCWGNNPSPTILDNKTNDGTGTGSFISNMEGLTGGTTYFVRAYATNSAGTAYGNEIEFKTIPSTVTDIDGNVYHTTIIGNQVWLVENLKTTKYRNGDPIPAITQNSAWGALTTGAYSSYLNDPSNSAIYGQLYNWHTVADNRKISPTGWHVPSAEEWTELSTFLGGELIAGGKLKEAGLVHWQSPNEGSTNTTGFTALPGGYRRTDGTYSDNLGYMGVWWSATANSINEARALFMYFDGPDLHGEPNDKNLGFSVRCIMD